jgi:hypothetical protein
MSSLPSGLRHGHLDAPQIQTEGTTYFSNIFSAALQSFSGSRSPLLRKLDDELRVRPRGGLDDRVAQACSTRVSNAAVSFSTSSDSNQTSPCTSTRIGTGGLPEPAPVRLRVSYCTFALACHYGIYRRSFIPAVNGLIGPPPSGLCPSGGGGAIVPR